MHPLQQAGFLIGLISVIYYFSNCYNQHIEGVRHLSQCETSLAMMVLSLIAFVIGTLIMFVKRKDVDKDKE